MSQTNNYRHRLGAFVKGLDTWSVSDVCAATYLYSELNNFPAIADDFSYEPGLGMDSKKIRRDYLPVVFDDIKFRDYSEFEDDRTAGKLLSDCNPDLEELALYLYQNSGGDVSEAITQKAENINERSSEMENSLSEIEGQLTRQKQRHYH